MPLPALLTIQSGINQLRYATLKGIMAAKKKEIRVVPAPAGLTPLVEIRVAGDARQKQKQTRLITGTRAGGRGASWCAPCARTRGSSRTAR